MKKTSSPSAITDKDRLGLTLFLAAALHGILILGLSFKAITTHSKPPLAMLNVLLVQTSSNSAPKEAKYIAQTNELASGHSNHSGHPGQPFFSPSLKHSNGVTPIPLTKSRLQRTNKPKRHYNVLTSKRSDTHLPSKTRQRLTHKTQQENTQHNLHLQLQQAKLTAEIRREINNYNHRPRRLYLDTVNAKTSVEASYLAHWVQQVERVGNLNYPNKVIQRQLHGRLILNVLISASGQVLKVHVAQSSGSRILDDAAKHIVRLAAPFKPFPPALGKRYTQLMITRTWIFQNKHVKTTAGS